MNKIQTREYVFDDLVGTVGGYIGLFTGYALIQLPELVNLMLRVFEKEIRDINVNNAFINK